MTARLFRILCRRSQIFKTSSSALPTLPKDKNSDAIIGPFEDMIAVVALVVIFTQLRNAAVALAAAATGTATPEILVEISRIKADVHLIKE
jgi:hypothetical protein